jgi:hypothetical protein
VRPIYRSTHLAILVLSLIELSSDKSLGEGTSMKYKFLIPIALMAAILGGLIFIGTNRKTEYTPSDEQTPKTSDWHWTDYEDKGK